MSSQTSINARPSFEVDEPAHVTARHKRAAAVVVSLAVAAGVALVGTAEAVTHKIVHQDALIGAGLIGVALAYGAYRYAQDVMSESYLEGKKDQACEEQAEQQTVEVNTGGQQVADRV